MLYPSIMWLKHRSPAQQSEDFRCLLCHLWLHGRLLLLKNKTPLLTRRSSLARTLDPLMAPESPLFRQYHDSVHVALQLFVFLLSPFVFIFVAFFSLNFHVVFDLPSATIVTTVTPPQIFLCNASRGCSPTLTRALRLDVLDNHGHSNYTCIYNIKVFGLEDEAHEQKSSNTAHAAH